MSRIYLHLIWDRLRASYWFVPAVTAVLLLTVPMSLAASQFGSRLLRLNMRDKTTQFVLGVFVGTFTYCLAAALSIPAGDIRPEGPQLTATVALLLTLASFASLLALIHHIGTALQAPNVAASASAELRSVVRSFAAESSRQSAIEHASEEGSVRALVGMEGCPIYAEGVGYIQEVDPSQVLPLATERDLVIRLVRKPGDFCRTGDLVALLWPAKAADPALIRRIRQCYQIGNGRTPTQDIEYGVNQLVEVAVRAMSPAINDPFTAITCLDHLGAGLALDAEQIGYHAYLYDSENWLRVIIDPLTFGELLDAAFNMIRRASRDNANVLSLLDAIGTIAEKSSAERQAELLRHVRLVEAENQASSSITWDQERIRRRSAELATRLQGSLLATVGERAVSS